MDGEVYNIKLPNLSLLTLKMCFIRGKIEERTVEKNV